MNQKTCRKQTLWVLIATVLIITLCAGGLWVYIKSADAETDVQETSLAELPKEDEITITWEKYDNFPLLEETKEDVYWRKGIGLMRDEKKRLENLKAEYANGKQPQSAAPTLPTQTGFAILPLDPASFGGMTEYYFFPETLLTDEQLLQLIAYGEEKGVPFTANTLTAGNSMRGSDSQVNRLFSAGETERCINLSIRCKQEGLKVPAQSGADLHLPIAGIAHIPMNPKSTGETYTFTIYPLRELTDDELLQDISISNNEFGYTYLSPVKDTRLNPAADSEKMRALLAEMMKMPKSAKQTNIAYKRKDATGEIHANAHFESAWINGIKTYYEAILDVEQGLVIKLEQLTHDKANPNPKNSTQRPKVTEDLYDSIWIDTVKAYAAKLTDKPIERTTAIRYAFFGNERMPGAIFKVVLKDGNSYQIAMRFSDCMVAWVYYGPADKDAMEWYNENRW